MSRVYGAVTIATLSAVIFRRLSGKSLWQKMNFSPKKQAQRNDTAIAISTQINPNMFENGFCVIASHTCDNAPPLALLIKNADSMNRNPTSDDSVPKIHVRITDERYSFLAPFNPENLKISSSTRLSINRFTGKITNHDHGSNSITQIGNIKLYSLVFCLFFI